MGAEDEAELYCARAELVLARDDVWPLREVPLDPDPLTPFANVFGRLRDDLEESAEVHVDLVPVPQRELMARRRKASQRLAEEHDPTSRGSVQRFIDGLLTGLGHPRSSKRGRGAPKGVARKQLRTEEKILSDALAKTTPHFEIQVLVRVRSAIEGRPKNHLQALLGCFDSWRGDNWWQVAGFRLFGKHFGADMPWRRRRFDRRIDQNRFRRRDNNIVAADEIAGLLKPPTANCPATNVVRTGGVVPPPPRRLPTFDHEGWQIPWGIVQDGGEARTVATRRDESLFSMSNGRSRYGKTETNLARFIHLARAGHGCLYLDPHADALARAKPYLTDQAGRVIELSIARGRADRQIAWNPFSMEGLGRADVEDKVSAIVDSFASAMRWSEINNRALSITQMTTQSLLQLALQLPDGLAPTIFQMATMLSREQWREAALPYLGPSLQDYWNTRFPKLSDEAITPITNVIDRLRGANSIAALLGSSTSTYDLRQAMDAGQVVLVRLRGNSQIDQLLASFVVYDLLRAVLSRWDMAPSQRRPFHVFLDEVQAYDSAVGGLLASALEQGGKYGLRLHLLCQQPDRLSRRTLEALLTNRSHLGSATVGHDSARLLATEFGREQVSPETIQGLDKYEFVSQVTDRGQLTTPFKMKGLHIPELFDAGDDEDVAELEAAIDANSGRRPVADVLGELAELDERILQALEAGDLQQADTAAAAAGADVVDIDAARNQPGGRSLRHSITGDDGKDRP